MLYLTGQDTGYILDASPGVDTGSFEPQAEGPFSKSTLTGTFSGGIDDVILPSATVELDTIAPSGIANVAGQSEIDSGTTQEQGVPFAANAWSINPNGTITLNTSGGAVVGIVVSSSKFVLFSPANSSTPFPVLLVMQK